MSAAGEPIDQRRVVLESSSGARVPVMVRGTVGSSGREDFTLQAPGRLRLEVQLRGESALVSDQGSRPPLSWRGAEQRAVVLVPGDELTAGGETLRLAIEVQRHHRQPELEAALDAAPDDEARWAVYGDWLLERGDALARLEEVTTLGPLMLEYRRGALVVEARLGLLVGASFRGRVWSASPSAVVRTLGVLPSARQLRRLRLDFSQGLVVFPGVPDIEEQLGRQLEALRTALEEGSFGRLRQLEVGPAWDEEAVALFERGLGPLPGLPHLEGARVARFAEAWLAVEGWATRQPLQRSGAFALGNAQLTFSSGGWSVSLRSQRAEDGVVNLNGERVGFLGARLTPGDALEQAGAFKATFGAQRVE